MPDVTTYIERVLIVLKPDGTVSGISVDEITAIDGKAVSVAQVPHESLADITDITDAINVASVAELAKLRSDLETANAEVERLTSLVPPPVDPNAVPEFITAVQGRLILRRMGLLAQIEAMITEMNGESQIFWEYSANWHRNNPTLQGLGNALNLTSDQVDEMFRAAKLIGEAE